MPDNWHTAGVPTGTAANTLWRCWASIPSFKASLSIQYLVSDNTGQGIFVNTIASTNLFTTSKVVFWCWGRFWSALALGYRTFLSPLDWGRGSTGVDGTTSKVDNVLRRVDFRCLTRGGSIAVDRFREFGSRGCAMMVSVLLRFFGCGILGVCNDMF